LLPKDFAEAFRDGSVLKPGIFGNCVFATFSKNIKHLTFAGCQSEIPLNSSQLLSTPLDSVWIGSIATNLLPNFRRCSG